MLGEAAASTLDGAALMVAAGAGSLAAGVPVAVMPAPLVAAGGLAMFLDSNLMRDYLLFVAGSLGTGVHPPHLSLSTPMTGIDLRATTEFTSVLPCWGHTAAVDLSV